MVAAAVDVIVEVGVLVAGVMVGGAVVLLLAVFTIRSVRRNMVDEKRRDE